MVVNRQSIMTLPPFSIRLRDLLKRIRCIITFCASEIIIENSQVDGVKSTDPNEAEGEKETKEQ